MNKTTIEGNNYVTPTFTAVDGGDMSIQGMQLDATVGDGQADFQRLDYEAGSACFYIWYTAAKVATLKDDTGAFLVPPEGANGCWVYTWTVGSGKNKKTYYKLPDGDDGFLAQGDAVQINMVEADKQIQNAGAVAENDMAQTAVAGNNYVGNPFPVDINVQAFQLDATVGDGQADFQRLDHEAGSACFYIWYTAAKVATLKDDTGAFLVPPEGANGCWVYTWTVGSGKNKKTYFKLPDGDDGFLAQGDGVQINAAAAEKEIQNAGAVAENDMAQETIEGNNYVGNPFPVDINVQAFQMDETVGDLQANFQRLDYRAGSACKYDWYTAASAAQLKDDTGAFIVPPEGANGCWVYTWTVGSGKNKKTYFKLPDGADGIVKAGDGLQINAAAEKKTITVLCPYDLKASK